MRGRARVSRGADPVDLEADDFRTHPTPIDNALLEASPGEVSFVTESGRSQHDRASTPRGAPAVAAEATVPMLDRPVAAEEPPHIACAARRRLSETPVGAAATPETPPESDARPGSSRSAPSGRGVRERLAARPVLLFFGALAIIAGVGVPSAVATSVSPAGGPTLGAAAVTASRQTPVVARGRAPALATASASRFLS